MRQVAKIVIVCFLVLLTSGCADKACTPIIVRCAVTNPPVPDINTTCNGANELETAKCALGNYVKMREYAEILRVSLEGCR